MEETYDLERVEWALNQEVITEKWWLKKTGRFSDILKQRG